MVYKFGKHEIEIFDSIHKLPFLRFQRFNKYQMQAVEIGSTFEDYNRRMEKGLQFIKKGMMDQAIMELLWDEGVTDKIATVEALLDGRETLAQRYLRVQLYMEVGRFAEAISLLEDVPV